MVVSRKDTNKLGQNQIKPLIFYAKLGWIASVQFVQGVCTSCAEPLHKLCRTFAQSVQNRCANRALLLSLHTFWQHGGVKVREGAFTCKDLVVNTLRKCEGVKALSIFLYGKLFTAYLSC